MNPAQDFTRALMLAMTGRCAHRVRGTGGAATSAPDLAVSADVRVYMAG
jgi:hypothetical protein